MSIWGTQFDPYQWPLELQVEVLSRYSLQRREEAQVGMSFGSA